MEDSIAANEAVNANQRSPTGGRPDHASDRDYPVEDLARARWEKRAEWPLTAAGVMFLIAYAWPILDPSMEPTSRAICDAVVWATWAVFALDYGVRLILSRDRWQFLRTTPVEFATVVLPILRPLRLLRLLTVLSGLNRYAGQSLRGKVAVYVAGSVALTLTIASLAVLDVERGADDGNIRTFGDAAWWATTTMTTVGYGDRFPVTSGGRLIAGGLMLTGIALIGVVTASLASWLLDRVRAVEQASEAATRKDIAALTAEVAAMRRELATARGTPSVGRGAEESDSSGS